MSHGLGVTAALRALPDAVVLLFAVLTQLGDVWFYVLALTLAYAFAGSTPRVGDALDRDRVAVLVALALGAAALTAGLKAAIGHPRPPGAGVLRPVPWLPDGLVPLFESFGTAEGASLPSGHATGTAAVYGGAALVVEYGRRRARYLAAGAVVAVVAASRVVIGVHYLGDVLAGLAVGGAYLAVVYHATDGGERVGRAFTLAVLVAVAGAAATVTPETAAALGGALGGRLGWTLFGVHATFGTATRREGVVATAVAVPVGGGLVVLGYAADAPVVAFLSSALGLATVLAAPLLARRVLGEGPAGRTATESEA